MPEILHWDVKNIYCLDKPTTNWCRTSAIAINHQVQSLLLTAPRPPSIGVHKQYIE